MKHIEPEKFEPVRRQTRRDWDGWLLVSWLAFAVACAVAAVITGHAQ